VGFLAGEATQGELQGELQRNFNSKETVTTVVTQSHFQGLTLKHTINDPESLNEVINEH